METNESKIELNELELQVLKQSIKLHGFSGMSPDNEKKAFDSLIDKATALMSELNDYGHDDLLKWLYGKYKAQNGIKTSIEEYVNEFGFDLDDLSNDELDTVKLELKAINNGQKIEESILADKPGASFMFVD